jgi:anti-sigma B factor antagonist
VTELSIAVTVPAAEDGACTVVHLAGEADITSHSLRDVLAAETAKRPRLLLVEMGALRFIDSAALEMIINAHHRVQRDGGTAALVHPDSAVARVLELTGVDQMIPVYGSVDEAIAAVE